MNVARSSAKLFVANVATAAIGLAGLLFFARELGPAGFGVVVLFQSLVHVLTFASDVGVGTAVQKRISEGTDASAFLAAGTLLKTVLLLLAAVGILLVRGPVNAYVGRDVALLLLLAVVLNGLGSLTLDVLRGELRVGDTAVLEVARTLSYVLVGGLLVAAGFGVRGAIYGLLLGYAVRLVWGATRCSIRPGRPTVGHARSLLDFAKYDFVGGLGSHAFNWVDVLVIGWFLGQAAAGTYEVAWRIAGVTLLLSKALNASVFPQVSRWYAEGEIGRIEGLLEDVLAPSLFLVVPAFAGVVLLARPLLATVFGPAYAAGALALVVLTGMKLLSAVHAVVVPALLGIDRADLNARATVVAVALNLVLNVALVPRFGVLGAAVATALAFAANLGLTTAYLSRTVDVRLPWQEVGWCVVAAVVMAGAIRSLGVAGSIETPLHLAGVVAFGALVYGAVVLLSGELRRQVVSNVRAVLG